MTLYLHEEDIRRQSMEKGRAEGRAEGKAEDILELLGEFGDVSDKLKEKILNQTDLEILSKWLRIVFKADSVEDFIKKAEIVYKE